MTESVGQQLKHAREEQEISLREASEATCMKERYLRALEEDHSDVFPSQVQQQGFLRSYADYLGLNSEALLGKTARDQESSREKTPGEPDPSPDSAPPSQGELEKEGRTLKEQREQLGFSLEDVEQQVHIKPRYLKALEEGRMDGLPSPVQGRGMLKNYAEFLGLDPEPFLLEFAEQLQARLREKYPDRAQSGTPSTIELTSPTFFQQVFSRHLLISSLIVIFLLVIVVVGSVQVFRRSGAAGELTATIPGVGDVLLPSDTPTPTLTITPTPQEAVTIAVEATQPEEEEEEVVENTPLPAAEGTIQIQLVISQRSFVQVTVDGEVVFNGRMVPGSAYEFGGDQSIEILTGNAAGVRVIFNERDLGVLGLFGEVANLVFTEDGILTPTPTITLTPTPTNTFTPTLPVEE